MANFKTQIEEDILDYQENHPEISMMQKPEWAFNFWVLDKLYSIDEDLIMEHILEYGDLGTDCYVWHEDSKDLYLIQNKYYSESTPLKVEYVSQNFLVRTLGALENNVYTRSKELQRIFNENKDDEFFAIHLRMYVTKNNNNPEFNNAINYFNSQHVNYDAKIFWLDDLEKAYFGTPTVNKKKMSFDIQSINGKTLLSINPKDYKLNQPLYARYVFTPVLNIYELVKAAEECGYPLFEDNVREYLGARGAVNKGIKNTLRNPEDRVNFFYYNNGITMIANNYSTVEPRGSGDYVKINVENPQIVNGCQTVSTIYETLKDLDPKEIAEEFKDTFVMVKILTIPPTTEMMELCHNIVKYNNSQNSISKKTFDSLSPTYLRIQSEFLKKGFLLCVKQSDKNKFEDKYKGSAHLLKKSNMKDLDLFGLKITDNYKDYIVDLETLLQCFVAFTNSQEAVQKKSQLLNPESEPHRKVMDFIDKTTNADRLAIMLLYKRIKASIAEGNHKSVINSFMMINCFGRYQCNDDPSKIKEILSCRENIDSIIDHYIPMLTMYKTNGGAERVYNDMIKQPIDFTQMNACEVTVNSFKPVVLK